MVDDGVLGVAICYDFDAPAITGELVRSGATVRARPTMDQIEEWSKAQHDHHALLFRLRAVENDRWLVRASSSGDFEAISPSGQPSQEGVEVGEVGHVVITFAHRSTFPWGANRAPRSCGGTGNVAVSCGPWRSMLVRRE